MNQPPPSPAFCRRILNRKWIILFLLLISIPAQAEPEALWLPGMWTHREDGKVFAAAFRSDEAEVDVVLACLAGGQIQKISPPLLSTSIGAQQIGKWGIGRVWYLMPDEGETGEFCLAQMGQVGDYDVAVLARSSAAANFTLGEQWQKTRDNSPSAKQIADRIATAWKMPAEKVRKLLVSPEGWGETEVMLEQRALDSDVWEPVLETTVHGFERLRLRESYDLTIHVKELGGEKSVRVARLWQLQVKDGALRLVELPLQILKS